MTTPLALPFNQLFSDREEAKWAFSFIRETLNQLGVPGPYDPRVAVVFARSKGNLHLRIHLGYAEVLEFCDPNSKQHGINLPFLTDNLPTDPDLPHWPLDREEDEPKVFIYKIPTAKVRAMPQSVARSLSPYLVLHCGAPDQLGTQPLPQATSGGLV